MKIDGKPVVDARKKIIVHITEEDIKKGDTKDPAACAAARSLMRLPDVKRARVHLGRTYIDVGDKWLRLNTGLPLRTEIVSFDRGGGFAPGTYAVSPLAQSEKAQRGRRQGSDKPGARDRGSKDRTPKKPRGKHHVVSGVRAHGANR